jgi:hypothetical protein
MKRRALLSRYLAGLTVGLGLLGGPVVGALEAPKGKVVLTVTGKVGTPNQGDTVVFDMAMLQTLPQRTFSTQTPWEAKPTTFSGPLLRDVLSAAKATGTTLEATALNDYKISFPLSDATDFDVVMALKINGEPIPVRTKGPLFIVYPFDSKPELKAAKYYERSIWQLKALSVR